MQSKHPIDFVSGKLHPYERIYSVYDKEMLDIMHALVMFRKYLVWSKFLIKTNHNSLRHFLSQKDLNDRHQNCVSELQDFDFDIEYSKGHMNVVIDALFRKPILAMLKLQDDWKVQLAVEYSKN